MNGCGAEQAAAVKVQPPTENPEQGLGEHRCYYSKTRYYAFLLPQWSIGDAYTLPNWTI